MITIHTCTFRRKFYRLSFGGAGGYGTSYEWLGVAIRVTHKEPGK